MPIDIQAFQHDDRQAERLWRFDCDLYQGDDAWIPPFRGTYLQPFVAAGRQSLAAGDHRMHFLAEENGAVVGHVSALVNHQLRDHDEPIGSLGYFECVEDRSVATALFQCAIDWLQSNCSPRRIWAPFNSDIWHGYRLMTRGFGQEPFVGEPHNPAYYPAFFEQSGFTVHKRWRTVELISSQSLQDLQRSCLERYLEIVEKGYRFQPFNARRRKQIHALTQMIVNSYQGFLGFTVPPPGTLEELLKGLGRMTDLRCSSLVHDPVGTPCGFAVAYPDQSAAVRAMRGRLGVRGRVRFLTHRRRNPQRFIFYLIGIRPEEYQKHHGLGRAIFYDTLDKILQNGFSSLLLAIIADDSPSPSLVGRYMDFANREYVLYEKVPP